MLAKVLAVSVLRFFDAEVKSISRIRWNGDANFAGVGNSQYAGLFSRNTDWHNLVGSI